MSEVKEQKSVEKKVTKTKSQQEIIDKIKKMSILELNDLVKAIEKEFDVKAAMAVSGPTTGGTTEKDESAELSEVSVVLKAIGGNKVSVIKAIKEITGLGLMEAKKLIETAPVAIKEKVKIEDAKELVAKLQATGAEVETK